MSLTLPGAIQPDGFLSLLGGVDAGKLPSLINENQAHAAENITFREGAPKTRPGWVYSEVNYPSDEVETNFLTGNPQGMKAYQSGDKGYLILSIDGRIYAVDVLENFKLQDITPPSGPNSSNLPKAYMQQVGDFFIIQDGQSAPIYIKGLQATRSGAGPEDIPVGTAMAYGWGRLWVARGAEFVAGDIDNGANGVITFSEQNFLAEGGAFRLPAFMGNINAMAFIPLQDTATGQGQLLIGGDFGVASFAGGIPRQLWQDSQIQQVALLDIGWVGQDASALLNGDIFYRSYDGIRSYRMARAQQGINGNTPQSEEVQQYVNTDTQEYLRYCSAVYFDGRILMTVAPQWRGTYCYHKGLVVLDSTPQSSIQGKYPPIWEGLWTGPKIVQITKGIFNKRERCFALVREIDDTIYGTVNNIDGDDITVQYPDRFEEGKTYYIQNAGYYNVASKSGTTLTLAPVRTTGSITVGANITGGEYNQIWELSKDSPFDVLGIEKHRIKSKLWTRSFIHGSPFTQKRLAGGQFWADRVIGEVDWRLSYRPNQYPCFLDWATGSVCAEYESCEETCPTTLTRRPGYKTNIKVGPPKEECLLKGENTSTIGFEFQWLLEWEGHMRVRGARELATDIPEDPHGNCNG